MELEVNSFHMGAFVDYYGNPDNGFHVLGEVGYAQLKATTANVTQNLSGLGLAAGIGYDWWVSNAWSLGILGRFMFSPMRREEFDSTNLMYRPSLLFTATYH